MLHNNSLYNIPLLTVN